MKGKIMEKKNSGKERMNERDGAGGNVWRNKSWRKRRIKRKVINYIKKWGKKDKNRTEIEKERKGQKKGKKEIHRRMEKKKK